MSMIILIIELKNFYFHVVSQVENLTLLVLLNEISVNNCNTARN